MVMPSADHLQQHTFKQAGDEPLAKQPISLRLYATDDEQVRAMGKDARLFIREAVRLHLQRSQQGSQQDSQ